MQSALDAFDDCLARVRHIHGLHKVLEVQLTSAVDLSDILRAEIVMAVSALDHYIHEISRLGMLECWIGTRATTDAYNRFPLTIASTALLINSATAHAALSNEIRTKHSLQSFQKPDKIADAIRLFSSVSLWDAVAVKLGIPAKDIKFVLSLIVDRRNKIAHEADVDPSYPGQRWPINPEMAEDMVAKIEEIGHAIHAVCV